MTDSTGTVVWAAEYSPFGQATITVSTITNNVRGIRQYFDQETGLIYNYFRDLNPAIGRYIEADRIGLRGGVNPYRYVGNNPVNYIDPWGLTQQMIGQNNGRPVVLNPETGTVSDGFTDATSPEDEAYANKIMSQIETAYKTAIQAIAEYLKIRGGDDPVYVPELVDDLMKKHKEEQEKKKNQKKQCP